MCVPVENQFFGGYRHSPAHFLFIGKNKSKRHRKCPFNFWAAAPGRVAAMAFFLRRAVAVHWHVPAHLSNVNSNLELYAGRFLKAHFERDISPPPVSLGLDNFRLASMQ